jgi:anti-sigma regulatory factor (Ser/Thr protein kinase)
MSTHIDSGQTFHARLPATQPSVATFRAQLRTWLEGRGVHPGEIFDVVLACSESLTLVIEEAKRQVALIVEVLGQLEGDLLTVTTRDYGLLHDRHTQEQEEPLSLALMRAMMDSVELQRHPDGQTITLRRRLKLMDVSAATVSRPASGR